jgi:S-adenosylmethionine hydrolase
MEHPVIALLTDFGIEDVYVGVMKGVILSLSPRARIVDVTHSIPRHDALAGSLALSASYRFFPLGTVFVVVVDPGVGGGRAVICARAGGRYFLAPDNGVLSAVLDEAGYEALVKVERRDLFLEPVSATFHGRDIFAPVAAHISRGLDIGSLGPAVTEYVRVAAPPPEIGKKRIRASVLWVDGFGNVVTNIPAAAARDVMGQWRGIAVEGKAVTLPFVTSYDSVAPGEVLAIVGSSNLLEISVREGSAARRLGLSRGESVVLAESEGA